MSQLAEKKILDTIKASLVSEGSNIFLVQNSCHYYYVKQGRNCTVCIIIILIIDITIQLLLLIFDINKGEDGETHLKRKAEKKAIKLYILLAYQYEKRIKPEFEQVHHQSKHFCFLIFQ